MANFKELTLKLDQDCDLIQRIRNATGLVDEEWLKSAIGIYSVLLDHSSDNTIRFVREDGRTAIMGLTPEADEFLSAEFSGTSKG